MKYIPVTCHRCGLILDSFGVVKFSKLGVVCANCGRYFITDVIGRYIGEKVYENTVAHRLVIVPFPCPNCGISPKVHELYCNLKNGNDPDVLRRETINNRPKSGL
jgi:hypothetical protein